jgi:serine/threonine protein kinase
MYDDIIHLAMDQALLTEIGARDTINYKKLPLWKELQKGDDTTELELKMEESGELTFENIFFREPVGYHLMKSFLIQEYAADKAVFLSDCQVFKTLQDPSARAQVARKIYERFCAEEAIDDGDDILSASHSAGRSKGMSVFEKKRTGDESDDGAGLHEDSETEKAERAMSKYTSSLLTEHTNSIGVYGKPISMLKKKLEDVDYIIEKDFFDDIAEEVRNDLRLDVFPRFRRSKWFKMYLRCQLYIEEKCSSKMISVREFHQMRTLGRGAFGLVNACKKKDTGKLYAMKQINKKRVQATDSVEAIMSERNFLADIGVGQNDCRYVTTLKYAFMDDTTLYLVLDLMTGGDLKHHLNHERTFSERRSRFYAGQVLLGLEHIHSKKIVYRDLKLENVLMDDTGNLKLSDLGLAVRMMDDSGAEKLVRGYAGTPGYTAPEVVLGHYYNHIVDFFSLGVMIYRFLCGKKPFQSPKRRKSDRDQRRNQSAELDRNVVEMEPPFPPEYFTAAARSLIKGLLCKDPQKRLGANGIQEIKEHPWFDDLDFGLLEAGYIDPPFTPSPDEIYAEQQQHIGRPPQDDQYAKTKITPEFEQALEEFPYVSRVIIQEEIVEVLEKINATERKHGRGMHKGPDADIVLIGPSDDARGSQSCVPCTLM